MEAATARTSSATGWTSTTSAVPGSWHRPSSQAGLDVDWLDVVADAVPPDVLDGAIRWLYYTVETELLMNEINDSTTRISTLVGAAKQYSQMDRAPFQSVDVHELLDSTLTMLARKIRRASPSSRTTTTPCRRCRRTPPSSTRCGPT